MHRLPVAIAGVPLCFNQDVKGIMPHDASAASYIAMHLRLAQQRLLGLARGANTEGLTVGHLRAEPFMLPPTELLARFALAESAAQRLLVDQRLASVSSDTLFSSLVQRAFAGELT